MSYLDWVKLDFVLAVLLTVLFPLILLFLSFHEKNLLSRLLAYWRVSALLAISVYLLMGENSVGLLTGIAARILIPPVLWLGDGLMQSGQPLSDKSSLQHRLFRGWRFAVTGYCVAGVLFTLPLLPCGLSGYVTEGCASWFVPAQIFGSLLHDHKTWQTLSEYALVALVIYALYLLYAIYKLTAIRKTSV